MNKRVVDGNPSGSLSFSFKGEECSFCSSNTFSALVRVKEQGLGLDEEFRYVLCEACGSLKLVDIPTNLGKYYPPGSYYSLIEDSPNKSMKEILKDLASRVINRLSFDRKGLFVKLLERLELENATLHSIGILNPYKSSHVLDVGCGTGSILKFLNAHGYPNVQGLDPFIESGAGHSVPITKASFEDFNAPDNSFDIILFSHSLEHMVDPKAALLRASKLLSNEGFIVLRIPIVSRAFHTYGSNWYAISAPRHFNIPSMKGLRTLVAACGLKIVNQLFESDSEQFSVSERYLSGQMKSVAIPSPRQIIFNKLISSKSRKYRNMARELNEKGLGDKIAVCLSKF